MLGATQPCIYLAAMFAEGADLAVKEAPMLAQQGYRVTSRWLSRALAGSNLYLSNREAAEEDIEDIDRSHILLLKTEERGVYGTGGRHVEFGYAYARGKTLCTYGPGENVFQDLPEVRRFDSFPRFVIWLLAEHPVPLTMKGSVDRHEPGVPEGVV